MKTDDADGSFHRTLKLENTVWCPHCFRQLCRRCFTGVQTSEPLASDNVWQHAPRAPPLRRGMEQWNSVKTPPKRKFHTRSSSSRKRAQSRQAMLLDKQDQVLIVCWSLKEPLLGALSSCMPCLLPSLKEPLFCQALVSLSEMLSFVETLPVRISQREISCMSLSRLFAVSAAWMGCTWRRHKAAKTHTSWNVPLYWMLGHTLCSPFKDNTRSMILMHVMTPMTEPAGPPQSHATQSSASGAWRVTRSMTPMTDPAVSRQVTEL